MPSRQMALAVPAVALALGCGASLAATEAAGGHGAYGRPGSSPPPTIETFCSDLPGPADRPPLLIEAMPPAALEWLEAYVQAPGDEAGVRARAEAALAGWDALTAPGNASSGGITAMIGAFLQLLEGAYLAESLVAAADGEPPLRTLLLLEPLYDSLSLPPVFAGSFLQQIGRIAVEALSAEGAPVGVLGAGIDFLRILPDRARALHRYAAGLVVCRDAAEPAGVADALRHLADAASDWGDAEEAFVFRREVVRRAPGEAADSYALANAAYRTLDVALGDSEAARADSLCGAGCTDRPGDLSGLAEAARTLAGIGSPEGAEDALRAARCHETLGNLADAKWLFRQAAEEIPEDARPMTGLAGIAMTEALDAQTALGLLEAAGPDGRDRDYFDLLVATRAMVLVYAILPELARNPDAAASVVGPALAPLRSATESYAEFEPGRAGALLLLLDAAGRGLAAGPEDGTAMLEAAVAGLTARALELAGRYPDVPDVARVLLALAPFAASDREAFGALDVPLPEPLGSDAQFLARRASVRLAAVVRWRRPDASEGARAAIEAIPDGPGTAGLRAALGADEEAVAWRLGPEGPPPSTLRERYAAAADDGSLPADQRARVLNNLGAVLAALGDSGGAAERWRRSEDLGDDDTDVPSYNRLAVAALAENPAAEALDALRAGMESLAAGDGNPALRREALLWLAWLEDRNGNVAEAARRRAEADAVRGDALAGDPTLGDLGLVSRGSFSFGLGYSSVGGLVVNLEIGAWVWLVVPAPR